MVLKVHGFIIDKAGFRPVAGAAVEGFVQVKDNAVLAGKHAVSDDKGAFTLELDEAQWRKFIAEDPAAYLFVRIAYGKEHGQVLNTARTMRWRPATTATPVQIYVDTATPSTLHGVVTFGEKTPAAGVKLVAQRLGPRGRAEIGTATADARGAYAIAYAVDWSEHDKAFDLQLSAFAPEPPGDLLGASPVLRGAGPDARLDLALAPRADSLAAVSSALTKPLSAPLLAYLAGKNIHSLADLRASGGVPPDPGAAASLPAAEVAALNSLTALSIIGAPVPALAALVQAGVTSVTALAMRAPQEIEALLGKIATPNHARALVDQAAAASIYLSNRALQKRLDAATPGTVAEGFAGLFKITCTCDCASATSPQAYLAHLLRYTLEAVRYNGQTFGIGFLQNYFNQPLRDLPATCESSETMLAQARIAVEILRKDLAATGRTAAADSPQWYREAAYTQLLQYLDITYDELRQVYGTRSAAAKTKFVREKGLGVGDATDAQIVDAFYCDVQAALTANLAVTEPWLQTRFGLRSTLADPLDPDEADPTAVAVRRRALRAQWIRLDASAQRPLETLPIVDPDLIGELDLQDQAASPPNDNFGQWKPIDFLLRRRTELQVAQSLIATGFAAPVPPQTAGGLMRDLFVILANSTSAIPGSTLLVPPFGFKAGGAALDFPALTRMRDAAANGQNISADLATFNVSANDVATLVHYVETLDSNQPVTNEETDTVRRIILAHVKRAGFWPVWFTQEAANAAQGGHLGLEPTLFRLRVTTGDAPDPAWVARPRLAEPDERNLWEDILRARTRIIDGLTSDLASRIVNLETQLLPQLRNALVAWTGLGTIYTQAKVDALTDKYLVDFEAGGCQRVTRPSQAIETIQGLLYGVRDGLLTDPAWSIGDVAFDATMAWLGNYDTLRPAILAYLYPEPLLKPSLCTDMSPGFATALEVLRDGAPVGQNEAIAAYQGFAAYLTDIANLTLLAAAPAPGIAGGSAVYLLGSSGAGADTKIYWSVAIEQPDGKGDQGWWREIAAMRAVDEVGGAAICGQYVIAVTASVTASIRNLSLWRMPLPPSGSSVPQILAAAPDWEGPFSLDLPDGLNSFAAASVTPGNPGSAPVVVITANETTTYARPLANDGSGWTGRFRASQNQPFWRQLGAADPNDLPPLQGATFACSGSGQSDTVGDARFVLAADVDGDGADELIAFGSAAGFWSMKLSPAGQNLIWAPLGGPRAQTFDCMLPPPADATMFIAACGDFDGDGMQDEIVSVTDRLPLDDFPLYARKWDPGSGWLPLGTAPDSSDDAQFLLTSGFPSACVVGRFTTAERDQLLITFWAGYSAGSTYWSAVSSLAVCGLVNGAWSIENSTAVADIPETAGLTGGVAAAGYLMGTGRPQLLLQQIGAGGLANGRFWALEFVNGAWGIQSELDAGAISDSAQLLVRDFDGDGSDEVALVDNTAALRFFKWNVGAWTPIAMTLPSPVQHWTAADFEDDGSSFVIAQCSSNPHEGLPRHIDQAALVTGEQNPDLTLGSLVPVRALAAGRFAGAHVRPGIVALGTGCAFYAQFKSPTASIAIQPNFARYKPNLAVPYRLDDPTAVIGFRLIAPDAAGAASAQAFQVNAANRPRNQAYLEEAFYFLPVEIALRLQSAGAYELAIDWLQRVAWLAGAQLKVESAFLNLDAAGVLPERTGVANLDPLDAHAVARHRAGSYHRFTHLTWVRLLADDGDAEFSLATSQSLPRADALYRKALALLNAHPYAVAIDGCAAAIAALLADVSASPALAVLVPQLRTALSAEEDALALNDIITRIGAIVDSGQSDADKLAAIQKLLAGLGGAVTPPNFSERIGNEAALQLKVHLAVLPGVIGQIINFRAPQDIGGVRFVPLPQFSFCLPPSSDLLALKRRITLARQRLLNCLDIGGNELTVAPIGSAAPTSPANSAATVTVEPLPYRYETLVERAKQLLEIARQCEASMLNYIETAEQKQYTLLDAQRDLALANATEQLKAVQVQQATQDLGIAALQRDHAQDQVDQWSQMLRDGLSNWETAGLAAQWGAFALKQSAAVSTAVGYAASIQGWGEDILASGATAAANTLSAQAAAFDSLAQASNTQAGYERRAQTWSQNLGDAVRSVQIGNQTMLSATLKVQGAQIEQQIAGITSAFAADKVTYLTTKSFANQALYEWMADVLEGVYRFFLQQATQLARIAELKLAFVRQEPSQGLIKRDYTTPLRADSSPNVNSVSNATDSLRGLTGAANLLRDLYQLDQYAFLKNQRKQQLTETVSLAQLDPLAFAQLADTGRIVFETTNAALDTRLPGHYLRLVHRVRVSVIALTPPNVGIRATLSNAGVSRVVIADGDDFSTVTLQRGFEQVSYTVAVDATGQFQADVQPELLNRFEDSAMETQWVFDLPRPANPIDFDSIADILVTFEYTALFSSVLREKVIKSLPAIQAGERVFSLRYEFPDAWYDLFNAQPPATPIEARFTATASDFPPNLSDLRMTNLVFQVRFAGAIAQLDIDALSFTPNEATATTDGGAAHLDADGVISTRRANGSGWLRIIAGAAPVTGEWRLRFAGASQPQFIQATIDDILFAVSFEGRTLAWP